MELDPEPEPYHHSTRMSVGAIVGTVLGSVAGAACLGGIGMFLYSRMAGRGSHESDKLLSDVA